MEEKKTKWDLKSISGISGKVRRLIKDKMPESIDVGDILLILVLLFLFLEEDDDEVLIILGVLIFTWVKPLFSKDDED